MRLCRLCKNDDFKVQNLRGRRDSKMGSCKMVKSLLKHGRDILWQPSSKIQTFPKMALIKNNLHRTLFQSKLKSRLIPDSFRISKTLRQKAYKVKIFLRLKKIKASNTHVPTQNYPLLNSIAKNKLKSWTLQDPPL